VQWAHGEGRGGGQVQSAPGEGRGSQASLSSSPLTLSEGSCAPHPQGDMLQGGWGVHAQQRWGRRKHGDRGREMGPPGGPRPCAAAQEHCLRGPGESQGVRKLPRPPMAGLLA